MKLKLVLLFTSVLGFVLQGMAQRAYVKIDTVPTQGTVHHLYLNIQIPAGEMYMQSSQMCGSSVGKLSAPDPTTKHEYTSTIDPNGNQFRSIST